MRGLSDAFITTLKSGFLKPVLDIVKHDPTLCLEIRENYINIYYRGGNILKVAQRERKNVSFLAHFEKKYFISNAPPVLPQHSLDTLKDVSNWIDIVPSLKHEMDLWFGKHPKDEREFQQLMVRENNFGNVAKSTDYFICDIEYTKPNAKYRFDLIGVHWPSSPVVRKNNKNLGLAFIEIKYLDKALKNSSGLIEHLKAVESLVSDENSLKSFVEEMKKVFNQKRELGLIVKTNTIESISAVNPELIFILANHDPESKVLLKELKQIDVKKHKNIAIKFAVSNFMGYGLYEQNIHQLDIFLSRFKEQIYYAGNNS